jgi:uncharacterized protein (DUF427 family)
VVGAAERPERDGAAGEGADRADGVWSDRLGSAMCSACAAAEKDPCSTAARKYSSRNRGQRRGHDRAPSRNPGAADDVAADMTDQTHRTNKMVLLPGRRHPITVTPAGVRVVVSVAGKVLADTTAALTLREADYPPVLYLPREDVDMSLLERSTQQSYCPFKGDAAYYSITAAGDDGIDAVWTYEEPYDAVCEIKGHLAFYTNRAATVEELPL